MTKIENLSYVFQVLCLQNSYYKIIISKKKSISLMRNIKSQYGSQINLIKKKSVFSKSAIKALISSTSTPKLELEEIPYTITTIGAHHIHILHKPHS